jgi:hypothetical protein
MHKLLEINGVALPDPEGSFSLEKEDKYNEYEGENGEKTVEIIRENIISGNVSYKGLTAKEVKKIMNAITLVSTVKVYDPGSDALKEITAKITGVKHDKKFYKNDVSVWSLSFKLEEL